MDKNMPKQSHNRQICVSNRKAKSPVAAITTTSYLLLLVIVLITPQTYAADKGTFDPDVLCPLLPNGTIIKDPRYCNIYIVCMNDASVSGSCGDQFYDRNTGRCVDPNTIKCLTSNPCEGKNRTFVADPYSCNGFYHCLNGVGTYADCGEWNFYPDSPSCLEDYPCEITMYPEDYCNIVPEGVFIKDPESCNGYQTCWKSVLINATCPDGRFFNLANGGACSVRTSISCSENRCVNLGHDHMQMANIDGDGCVGYSICQDGKEIARGTCPSGQFFNEIAQRCTAEPVTYAACARASNADTFDALSSK